MKAPSILLCGLVLAALPCTSALADTFSFTFGGPHDPIYGYGTLTASPDGTTGSGGPKFLVTGITGVTAGQQITGVLDPGTFPVGIGFGQGNDNLLSDPASFKIPGEESPGYFDTKGLSYSLANGDYINLSETDDQLKGFNIDLFGFDQSLITKTSDETISITPAVPEPESLVLLGTGVLAAAGAIRRRLMA